MTQGRDPEDVDDLIKLANSWVEINRSQLTANAAAVKSLINPSMQAVPVALMAVVKANGYGLGAVRVARAFIDGGATWLGVTNVLEAKELLDGGVDSTAIPILVFAPIVTDEQASFGIDHGLHLTVCDSGHLDLVSRHAAAANKVANVHLKVDTGMSRLGLAPSEAIDVAKLIASNEYLTLAGVYTHFPNAGAADTRATRKQLAAYIQFCEEINAAGISGFIRHCANSAALVRLPDSWCDMVRVGNLLYGVALGTGPNRKIVKVGIKHDTHVFKSRVLFVHDLPSGVSVGYGSEYTTKKRTRAAVLSVGFADGYTMQPASLTTGIRGIRMWLTNLVKGARNPSVRLGATSVPVLGRVAMQMIVVDVTDCPQVVKVGDIAVIQARWLAINSRIPRITFYGAQGGTQ